MHPNSIKLMTEFRDKYLGSMHDHSAVLDCGSQGMKRQGTYRPLFEGFKYVGMDMTPGRNVDIVVEDPETWREIPNAQFSVVISGQMLEHTRRPWDVIQEMTRVLLCEGLMCVIVPWKCSFHPYPIDCWRILPDGMRGLAQTAGLVVLDTFMDGDDCVGIFTK